MLTSIYACMLGRHVQRQAHHGEGAGVGQRGVGDTLYTHKHTDQVFKLTNTKVYTHIHKPTHMIQNLTNLVAMLYQIE